MRRVAPRWAGTILTGILAAALTSLPVDAAGGHAFGTSEIVSRTDPAAISDTAGGESLVSSMSADGRYVALVSDATNLIPVQRDTNNTSDLFLYDRTTGEMTLVSHAAGLAATAGNSFAGLGALSADGRFLAFESYSDDLVPGSGAGNIFLYDRVTGATSLVSRSPSSFSPAISPLP